MDKSFAAAAKVAIANYQGSDPGYARKIAFFVEQFAERDLTDIRPEDVENALDELSRRGKIATRTTRDGVVFLHTGKPLAPATRNRYLSSLGTFYRDLRRLRLTPRGFVSPTKGVERESADNGRTLNVTAEEVRRLVASCRLSRNRTLAAITAMAATTGWRLGSLQALRWRDLDLKNGTADVQRTKNGTPHRAVLLDWVVEEIRRIQPDNAQPGDLVFGKKSFLKSWRKALELADLPTTWTFHHCRHMAASILAQSGASVPQIMSLLNHKSPAMALRYSHLNTTSLREGLARAWA